MRKADIKVGESYKAIDTGYLEGAKVTVVEGPTFRGCGGELGHLGWVVRLEQATRFDDVGKLRWVESRALARPWTAEDDDYEARRLARLARRDALRERHRKLGYGDVTIDGGGTLRTLNHDATERVLDALEAYWDERGGYPTRRGEQA